MSAGAKRNFDMTMILDSWALMAFFEDEPGAESVEKLLDEAEASGDFMLMSVINWGEVYYSVVRTSSMEAAEEVSRRIAAMPIRVIAVSEDLVLTKQAAIFKSQNRMSYADCFAAALAKITKGTLVTGDHEFRPLESTISIQWLPK
jgi:ribonuclease VapC